MKTLLTFSLILFSNLLFSQEVEVRSHDLNVLIWDKINERLESLGKNTIKVYDTGEMKDFGERVCERLIERDAEFKHSNNDSIAMYSGGECILSLIRTSTYYTDIELLTSLLNGDLNTIADAVVQSWVNSDSHREAISEDWYTSTTVNSIIRYDLAEGYFKISATWHQSNPYFGSLSSKSK